MSRLASTMVLAMANTQLVATWNLWKKGMLAPDAALEEMGRILNDCDETLLKQVSPDPSSHA